MVLSVSSWLLVHRLQPPGRHPGTPSGLHHRPCQLMKGYLADLPFARYFLFELSSPLSVQSSSFRLGFHCGPNLQDVWDIGKSPTNSGSLDSSRYSVTKSWSLLGSSPAFFGGSGAEARQAAGVWGGPDEGQGSPHPFRRPSHFGCNLHRGVSG